MVHSHAHTLTHPLPEHPLPESLFLLTKDSLGKRVCTRAHPVESLFWKKRKKKRTTHMLAKGTFPNSIGVLTTLV